MTEPRDSRLERFLKQAGAIIASEKGLTDQARAKLENLASRIHLPDELFQQGLEQLQSSTSAASLTTWEQGFLDYLIREFAKLPQGSVLTIKMEENAIALAKNRFEIPRYRAEQLIDRQTRESRLGRLSREDAQNFGKQMIFDRVGTRPQIDDEDLARISRLCDSWGLDRDEITEQVNQRLKENYENSLSVSKRRMSAVAGLAGLAAVALVAIAAWLLLGNRNPGGSTPVVNGGGSSTDPEVNVGTPINQPSRESQLRERFPVHGEKLLSENPDDREMALGSIVDQQVVAQSDPANALAIADVWLKEPVPGVADTLLARIETAISTKTESFLESKLQTPFRAIDLCEQIANSEQARSSPLQRMRLNQLRTLLDTTVGNVGPVLNADSWVNVRRGVAFRQWNDLIELSWSKTNRAASMVAPLEKVTRPFLNASDLNPLRQQAVNNILETDVTRWNAMKPSLLSSIATADRDQLMGWTNTYVLLESKESPGADFIASQLAKAWQAWPEALPESIPATRLPDYFIAIRDRAIRSKIGPTLNRDATIDQAIVRLKQQLADKQAGPQFTAEPEMISRIANLVNCCLEMENLLRDGKGGNEAAYIGVDQKLARQGKRLRDLVFLEGTSESGEGRRSNPATIDLRLLESSLETLANMSDDNLPRRLAAVDRLSDTASRYETLKGLHAKKLAGYLLEKHAEREWLDVQRAVPKFAGWNRLLLALSDEVASSNVSVDQALTIATLLCERQFEMNQSDWRAELSLKLFNVAHEMVQLKAGVVDPLSRQTDWVRLEKYLATVYRERLELTGYSTRPLPRQPAEQAALCLLTRASDSQKRRTARTIELIKNSTDNQIHQIVLFNQQLCQQQKTRADDRPMAMRLLLSEVDLLDTFDAARKEQVRVLVEGRRF